MGIGLDSGSRDSNLERNGVKRHEWAASANIKTNCQNKGVACIRANAGETFTPTRTVMNPLSRTNPHANGHNEKTNKM